MGQEAARRAAAGGIGAGEKISKSTLEEEARQSTLTGHGTPEERFWQRQRGQAETIAIGKSYIAKVIQSFCANELRAVTDIYRLHHRLLLPWSLRRSCNE